MVPEREDVRAVADHGGQQAGAKITRRINGVALKESGCQRNFYDGSTVGFVPVCIPREAPMPRIMMNKTRGARPGGGGPFRASPIAHTTIRRTALAKNCIKL